MHQSVHGSHGSKGAFFQRLSLNNFTLPLSITLAHRTQNLWCAPLYQSFLEHPSIYHQSYLLKTYEFKRCPQCMHVLNEVSDTHANMASGLNLHYIYLTVHILKIEWNIWFQTAAHKFQCPDCFETALSVTNLKLPRTGYWTCTGR